MTPCARSHASIARHDGLSKIPCIAEISADRPALHALYSAGEAMCAALLDAVPIAQKSA